jgi:hypothetical protein
MYKVYRTFSDYDNQLVFMTTNDEVAALQAAHTLREGGLNALVTENNFIYQYYNPITDFTLISSKKALDLALVAKSK